MTRNSSNQKKNETYEEYINRELNRIDNQVKSGYLSKKKIKDMQPSELIENIALLEAEVEKRALGMLFGV